VADELRTLIELLPPPERPCPKGGRPPPHQARLSGILFALKSGVPREPGIQHNAVR
jgi:hypothetical protein